MTKMIGREAWFRQYERDEAERAAETMPERYLMNDQPFVCPVCGLRAEPDGEFEVCPVHGSFAVEADNEEG